MTTSDPITLAYRSCRTLDGHAESLAIAKRGGRVVVALPAIWADGGPRRAPSSPWLDDPRFYVNLNATECRTWRRILAGASIAAIAAEDGVSRAAIYERIQGNRFGHGGMIAKNFWCLLWWRLRRRMTEGAR
ncbi:MAG: hypothetical protein HY040_26220 [Planctomycetes bacterium]|nr:hypothetical protein [Planctomycetota bacterium]